MQNISIYCESRIAFIITKSQLFSNLKGSYMAESSFQRKKVKEWGFQACSGYKDSVSRTVSTNINIQHFTAGHARH